MSSNADFRLRGFTGANYDKGRGVAWQAAWWATQHLLFKKWWFPASIRPTLLRLFGAHVGCRVHIRNDVRIHWPWKLTVGDDVWIGEGAHVLNLEHVKVGSDVCISQGSLLCTGSHDRRNPTFEFDNKPISIGNHSWIAARAIILPGAVVPERTTVGANVVYRPGAP